MNIVPDQTLLYPSSGPGLFCENTFLKLFRQNVVVLCCLTYTVNSYGHGGTVC